MTHPARKGPDSPEFGPELLALVRSGFVAQQRTMKAWCRDNDIAVQNARMALLGGWRGPKAKKLIAKIKKAAGVQ